MLDKTVDSSGNLTSSFSAKSRVCMKHSTSKFKHNIQNFANGNMQQTNQIASLVVTNFVGYLFRGNYFAALQHFSYAYWPGQPRLQFEGRRVFGRQTELLERFFHTSSRKRCTKQPRGSSCSKNKVASSHRSRAVLHQII